MCHAVSDRALRDLAEAGACAEEIARATRAGSDCGVCRGEVARVVADARGCGSPDPCPACPHRDPAPRREEFRDAA